jgi:signal transduction histidine kinase
VAFGHSSVDRTGRGLRSGGGVRRDRADAAAVRNGVRARRGRAVLDPTCGATDRVRLEIDERLPEVLADPGLLERVVVNVVDNALRHGTGAPVTLRASSYADRVELRIVDAGPGVPAAQVDRMFAPFQRLGDRGNSGLGLGLSVARGFTEAMGGIIAAEDTPGGGLTIMISLPTAPLLAELTS